jgi:predicted nucleic acid-binding protein
VSRVLLDTCALSELFRGHAGIREAVAMADQVGLNTVSLGELLAGFRGGTRSEENRASLEEFLHEPRVRTIGIDADTADRYARIFDSLRRAGTPIPTNDIWIAATAMQFGLRLVTTDRHYEHVAQVALELHEV